MTKKKFHGELLLNLIVPSMLRKASISSNYGTLAKNVVHLEYFQVLASFKYSKQKQNTLIQASLMSFVLVLSCWR